MKDKDFLGCSVIAVLVVSVFLVACGGSWLLMCGLVKLITLCFGWEFSWTIATGVWLVAWLLGGIFNDLRKDD